MKKVKKLGASPGGGDSLARYRAANGERENVFHSLKSVFLCIAHHPLGQGKKRDQTITSMICILSFGN